VQKSHSFYDLWTAQRAFEIVRSTLESIEQ
jgi:hypothetical protein